MAHTSLELQFINIDETVFQVSLRLLEQDRSRGAEGTLLGQCIAATREDDCVRVIHSERLPEQSSVTRLEPTEVLLLMP